MTLIVFVAVIITNKILLIDKGLNKEWWILPGGKIKNIKNFIEETKNLFFEQTGFQIEINSFYKKYTISDSSIIVSVNGKLCGGKMKNNQKKENIFWIPLEQIDKLDNIISTQADLIKMLISDCVAIPQQPLSKLKI